MGENIFSKTITVLALLLASIAQQALGQIIDDFSDGDFNNNPGWSGSTSHFMVDAMQRLQLNAPLAVDGGGSSFLTLPFVLPQNHNAQWEFLIHHNFAGSGASFGRVYLMSDNADLSQALHGYYLQLGETGTGDRIELFKQSGVSSTTVCRTTSPSISAAFTVRVRVTRSSIGAWEILVDASGGSAFVSQATGTDNTYTTSAHFGVRCVYADSFRDDFFYDDFNLTTSQAPDVTAPSLSNVTVVNSAEIQLNFSEALDATNGLIATQFVLNDTLVATAASFQESNTRITLAFPAAMINGRTQKIQFPAVSDPSGNTLNSGSQNFLFFQPVEPELHDIIINEIYADPSPSIGLPEFEFVEIFNRSQHPFQLSNWQLTDGTTTAMLTAKILLPGEFLTITPNAASAAFSALGPTMGVATFPSLNNSGDHLQLKNPAGNLIDEQTYSLAWYQDEDKDAGGYTLELVDPTNFCSGGENWRASTNSIGGSPGQQNSVFQITPDVTGPKLLEVVPKAANMITLKFDEPLSAIIPPLDNFSLSHPIEKTNSSFSNASNSEIDLAFAVSLDSTTHYTITLANFFDCPGNPLQGDFSSATFKMDMIKPTVLSLDVISQQKVQIQFSEKISPASIVSTALMTEEEIDFTVAQSANKTLLILDFGTPLTNGKDYLITIKTLTDYAGNTMNDDVRTFRFFQPVTALPKDIVVNEFLADQSPVVGLPESEFIELYNRSTKAINLQGWAITDGSSIGTLPDKILLPDQYLILCPASVAATYAQFGTAIGLSTFPSLNNSGDNVILKDVNGITIDSIHYSSMWYQNDDKEDGGWSLERINPNDFCGEMENWIASEDQTGGSPGKLNSVFAITDDVIPPDLLMLSVVGEDSLVVHFSERLAITSAVVDNFVFQPPLLVDTVSFTGNDKRQIGIKLSTPLDSVSHYQLEASNIFDCPGNLLPIDSATLYFKLDNVSPSVITVLVQNESMVFVSFSEKIDQTTALSKHFSVEGIIPEVKILDEFSVELVFTPAFVNGRKYKLSISNLTDLAGNRMTDELLDVLYFKPNPVKRKDIIISEIFGDPSPIIGLPETEYIEIYNRSQNPVQLQNWIVADATRESRLKDYILLPDAYLVLTVSSKAFQFENVLGVSSFPSLTNAGESIMLKDSAGFTIDSVLYSDDWYADSEKMDGGWSLELIDPENICAEGENWTASTNFFGGTPGNVNSVKTEKPDLTPPEVVSVIALSADTVVITFNEKLNETLPAIDDFGFTPALNVRSISFSDQSKRSLTIVLLSMLEKRIRYKAEVKNISDCAGNSFQKNEELFFALPESAEPGDIVINEILFNPTSTGVDFVELFNRSEKFINLKNWESANIVNDTIVNKKLISTKDHIIEPGDFLALTADPNILKGEYLQSDERKLRKANLPTLPDDEGSLWLLGESELVIDTLFYNEDQHSPFLKNNEGVSLERIDANAPASNRNNWHSASASSGYATPGLRNGNSVKNTFEESVSVTPEIFTPNEGVPDFAMISYNLESPGFVANIKIVNQQGRVVKAIAENELLGMEGFFTWRGETTQGSRAANGAYMVWFEMFDVSGNVVTIKKRVVVANRF